MNEQDQRRPTDRLILNQIDEILKKHPLPGPPAGESRLSDLLDPPTTHPSVEAVIQEQEFRLRRRLEPIGTIVGVVAANIGFYLLAPGYYTRDLFPASTSMVVAGGITGYFAARLLAHGIGHWFYR